MLPRSIPICLLLTGVSVLCWSVSAHAQGRGEEDLIRKRDEKLSSAFLSKADWITDYQKALQVAEEQHKLVFGYFTRSYSP